MPVLPGARRLRVSPPHDVDDDGAARIIDVDILGHIFEQSITDLERLRNELEGLAEKEGREQHASRRKKEGAFYTPAFITRYIVGQALGKVLDDRFEALRSRHLSEATGTARRVMDHPATYDLGALERTSAPALVRFWEAWQEELVEVRLLDPACGSGAFLIEAFDQLYQAYQRANDRLAELRGRRDLFDLDRRILQNNLYGVDLNGEAVQIARLSLWIKTAQRGKTLTSLDHTIHEGNSLIDDPAVHAKAFDWRAAFPEVFEKGGFDVVVGNPPYVRQEWIAPYKPYFQGAYRAFHGVADLYVYFYELGMRLLRPGGRLSYVVTNKWLKASYGEPLRRYFAAHAWIESVVDFGHAKQIFVDADVFPSIIVARKPDNGPAPETTRVCAIPRELLRISDLSQQIETEGYEIQRNRFTADAWSLEPKGVYDLISKIKGNGVPLSEHVGTKPLMGIKTGLNEAFLIDTPTRKALVDRDPSCAEVIRPYLRGQDIKRWQPDWNDLWMIVLKSSGDHSWPWSDAGDQAEDVFETDVSEPARAMKPLEPALRKRQDKGRFWWELRSCAYWKEFEKPKLIYQDITSCASFSLDNKLRYMNNTVYFLSKSDSFTLCVLNSPIGWWYAWRRAQHGKDEALRYFTTFVEEFPIPSPSTSVRELSERALAQLIEITSHRQNTVDSFLDWINIEYEIANPSTKLQNPIDLDSDALIAEVRKLRGKKNPLSLAAVRNLREEHARTIVPAQELAAETRRLEIEVSDLVNAAYGLTPDEVRLMWETAPPRMPVNPLAD